MRRGPLVALALVAFGLASACGRSDGTATPSSPETAADHADRLAEAVPDLPALTPEGLPEDLPIPDGLRAVSVTSEEPGSTTALFTGELEPEEVARVFKEGLSKSGWSIADSQERGSELGLLARKNQRVASVIVTRLSGKLHVELGVWAPPAK